MQYLGKKVIWTSKGKQWALVAASILLTIITIIEQHRYKPLVFWLTIIIFGGIGVFFLYRIISGKYLFLNEREELGRKILQNEFRKNFEGLGEFRYEKEGFHYNGKSRSGYYQWEDIQTITGSKTNDVLELTLMMANKNLLFIEEQTPGWHLFIKNLKKQLPQYFPADDQLRIILQSSSTAVLYAQTKH